MVITVDPKGEKTALVEAVLDGDLAKFLELLNACGPNAKSDRLVFHLAFWFACKSSFRLEEIAKIMLHHGADPNTRSTTGCDVLYLAVMNKTSFLVRMLLDRGADPNHPSKNWTVNFVPYPPAVRVALSRERYECYLDEALPSADKKDQTETPLYTAAAVTCGVGNRATEIAGLFSLHRAVCGPLFETPLEYVIWSGSPDMLQLLIDHGADVNVKSSSNRGQSLLHEAVLSQSCEMAKILLQSGADVNAVDNYEETALIYACQYDDQFPPSEMVQILLSHGADANVGYSRNGCTALLQAMKSSLWAAKLVTLLLHNGADPNIGCKSKNGGTSTVLLSAVKAKQHAILVPMLLQHGADPNIPEPWTGYTPLHYAAGLSNWDNFAELQQLLRSGAKTNVKATSGDTPLCLACKRGDLDMIFELFQLMIGQGYIEFCGNDGKPLLLKMKEFFSSLVHPQKQEGEKKGSD
jgi:ankyrin repeat protein